LKHISVSMKRCMKQPRRISTDLLLEKNDNQMIFKEIIILA
jgi:hypothetical protein